jgi:hypothetical protein
MSTLAIVVIASLILAATARSYWRQLLEVSILVVLFVFFVGALTLVILGNAALNI